MRAITFPRQADGSYVNAETGLRIRKFDYGYSVEKPSSRPNSRGEFYYDIDVRRSLAGARSVAVVNASIERERIAAAYDEAIVEHVNRAAERAEVAGINPWRVEAARRELSYGQGWYAAVLSEISRVDEQIRFEVETRETRTEDDGPGCTRASDWTGEHLFEDYEIERNPEGIDEFERCERPADDPIHVEGAHAAALREADRRIADEQVKALGWIEQVKEYRARTGCGLWQAVQGARDEVHAEALCEDYARWRAAAPECLPECKESDPRKGHLPVCPGSAYAAAGPSGEDLIVHPDRGFGARWPEDAGRVCWVSVARDMAIAEQATRDAAQIIADNRRLATSWHIGGMLTEPQPGDIVRINRGAVQGNPNRYFTEWKVLEFAADRKRVKVDLVRGSLLGPQWEDWGSLDLIRRPAIYVPTSSGLPAPAHWPGTGAGKSEARRLVSLPSVPADVDDDEAWAAYCAAVPEPAEAEHQATARDFGPYATERAAAVQAFRECARDYWTLRRGAETKLHEACLRSLRRSMNTIAGTVRLYDRMTEAWRVAEQADTARDTFSVSH